MVVRGLVSLGEDDMCILWGPPKTLPYTTSFSLLSIFFSHSLTSTVCHQLLEWKKRKGKKKEKLQIWTHLRKWLKTIWLNFCSYLLTITMSIWSYHGYKTKAWVGLRFVYHGFVTEGSTKILEPFTYTCSPIRLFSLGSQPSKYMTVFSLKNQF